MKIEGLNEILLDWNGKPIELPESAEPDAPKLQVTLATAMMMVLSSYRPAKGPEGLLQSLSVDTLGRRLSQAREKKSREIEVGDMEVAALKSAAEQATESLPVVYLAAVARVLKPNEATT